VQQQASPYLQPVAGSQRWYLWHSCLQWHTSVFGWLCCFWAWCFIIIFNDLEYLHIISLLVASRERFQTRNACLFHWRTLSFWLTTSFVCIISVDDTGTPPSFKEIDFVCLFS
jgi:hypothetical protein